MSDSTLGVEIIVRGIVQGVGFRPFVYRLAHQFDIFGTISNSDQGVVIEAEGRRASLQGFIHNLRTAPPPMARISSLHERILSGLKNFTEFSILASTSSQQSRAIIPADIALCEDCLREISDPADRRYAYPFTNCTNCGPRFTIVESIPYDRPFTSMRDFALCGRCRAEYEDPMDRRFHAQPNACPDCGPSLSFHDAVGEQVPVASPLAEVARLLKEGQIVAMRGLGGFHLVVDGYSEAAVDRLRSRKGRQEKPLAVMVADLEEAERICEVSAEAEQLLSGVVRPIVLLPRRASRLARGLTPGIHEIGLMLPYTPLHQLLFQEECCPRTLVMTSGNRSGAPIFTGSDAAVAGLRNIADGFLLHNREIVTRVDDSLVRVSGRGPQLLRRARGYVPGSVKLPMTMVPILACGGGLKSTFCLTREEEGFLSQHIGDLFNLESLDFYKESIYHLKKLLEVEPEAVVCDLHPDYLSTHYARETGLPLYRVQHHHAHVAAVLVEHGIEGKVLGLVLDGSGLGDDKSIWGGEVLEADCSSYRRLGSLTPMLLPGGDAAAESPWRMGLSLLHGLGKDAADLSLVEQEKEDVLFQMMAKGFNCPLSTSCGRFFDGIAALLGVCLYSSYEGQAAMELESLARQGMKKRSLEELLAVPGRPLRLAREGGRLQLAQMELVREVLSWLAAGRAPAEIALDVHLALIQGFSLLLRELGRQTGLKRVVLSGGCMQNTILLEGLFLLLEREGFSVYSGEQIPVNDGGIALGQAVIGGLRHVSGSTHEGP